MSEQIRKLTFHPFAEDYPLMPAYELGRMEEDMIERGFDPRFPIVLYHGEILDGRNRYLAAKKAGVKPLFVSFKGTEEEARLFVQRANEERRHLAQDWLQRRRQERIERVAQARQEGKSQRAIAEQEGISRAQVREDLEEAVGQGCPTEPPPTVTGTDGKTYQGSKPASAPVPTPQSKLIPELRLKLSPKFLPEVEAAGLSVAQQYAMLARVSEHMPARQALAEAIAEVKGQDFPPPTDLFQEEYLVSAERILASAGAMGCSLTSGQAKALVEEIKRLRANQKPRPNLNGARTPDPLFDAIAEVCGADPKASGGHIAKVKKALLQAEPPYTPEEVRKWGQMVHGEGWLKGFPTLGHLEKTIGKVRAKPPEGSRKPMRGEYVPD